ncbi:MAG: serine/threonine-protein kinase [Vicinamibacteria bacterium]
MPATPDHRGARSLLERCLLEPEFARRYDVARFQVLGEGSFACVARVHDRDLGQDVAVKMFWRATEELKARIRAEVANAQRVRSETIVQVHSVSFGEHGSWMQMELVDGPSLDHELERRTMANAPFPLAEALLVARDAADGLARAHAVGVAHRDVKPSNYLMPADRRPLVKLGDFGISKHVDADNLTATGEFPGTPAYAALEIFDGRPAGPASDVYSLGLVVFRVLSCGQYPFELSARPTPLEFLSAHRSGRARRLRDLAPGVPRAVEQAVADALARAPRDRPEAAAVRDILDQACRENSGPVMPPAVTGTKRAVSIGGAAAAVLLGMALVGLRWGGASGNPASLPAGPDPQAAPATAASAPPPGGTVVSAAPVAPQPDDTGRPPSIASAAPVRPVLPSPRVETAPSAAPPTLTPQPEPTSPEPSGPPPTPEPAPVATPEPTPLPTPAPTTVAAAPAPAPAARVPVLRVMPGVAVGGGAAAARAARLTLELMPNHVLRGEPYVVEVRIANEDKQPIRIASLSVVDTSNGRRRGAPAAPLEREVKPGRQAVVNRIAGKWPSDLETWTLEVFVTAEGGDTLKGMVTWR